MQVTNRKQHWEHIYSTKTPDQVSWTQEVPATSLEFIHQMNPDKSARIIDVGGGDSKLVDYLIQEGFQNITVLDISLQAIERAKMRLGAKADEVNWVVSDINDFEPQQSYDLWHDRAAFHFLTDTAQVNSYVSMVASSARNLIIGTFSVDGPFKCSGLEVKQYDENSMSNLFVKAGFSDPNCKRADHVTPSGTIQNFQFCSFKKEKGL